MKNSKQLPGAALKVEDSSVLSIRTPEGVVFTMLLAGPISRFLAWAVDFLCVAAAMSVFGMLSSIFGLISRDLSIAIYILAYFIISIGYTMAAEWLWRGQTIGKRLLNLRVMEAQGFRMRPSQIIIRNLMRFVDALPLFYLVGGVACLLSPRAQRLGDLTANTIVIRNPKIPAPALNQLMAGKYNSLREHPYLAARLRQQVSPAEAGIALDAIMRRDEFEPLERAALFEELAAHFKAMVEFPAEAQHGLTAEQYVRNVVDILFR